MKIRSASSFTAVSLAIGLASLAFSTKASAQTDCANGYVPRNAFPGDAVCVTPETRDLVAQEHRNAQHLGRHGECEAGFVWRMAGPQDHVCVTQVERDQAQRDNGLARGRTAGAARPAVPELRIPGARENVTSPPEKEGCYRYESGEWREIECLSEEFVRKNFPPPVQNSIRSNPTLLLSQFINVRFPYVSPIVLASVDLFHLSDPAEGIVKDSLAGDDAFSIQVNTNFFPGNNGNTDWVQFVLQSQPSAATDILCVWNVDVTVANATKNVNGYSPTCVAVPKQRTVFGPDDPWPTGGKKRTFLGPGATMAESSKVAGYVSTAGGGSQLVAWAYVPWAPSSAYSVSARDQYGLRGRWTEVSGDIIGLGNGSRANFSRTKIRTVIRASSCNVGGASYPCPQTTSPQYNFANYAAPSVTAVTAEDNNLASTYDFTEHEPTFSCVQGTCTLDYSTGPLSILRIRASEYFNPRDPLRREP